MTQREFYNAIINGEINDEVITFATESVTKLDHTNEARRVKAAEKAVAKQAEKAPIREAIFAVVGDAEHPLTASALIEAAGLTDTVKPASIPSLLKPLVEAGDIVKVDVKIPGKGTQRGYVRG